MPFFILAAAFVALCAVWSAGPAAAQTGVSDDRVSLPDGPGSLEGVGDNAAVDPNMGHMGYSVDIDVPPGFAGVTPALKLVYGSGAGTSAVGIGWSLLTPSIERMTARGLPQYVADDRFVANGSDQLVRIPGTEPPVYRSRFESGFVRYTWQEAGDGSAGH